MSLLNDASLVLIPSGYKEDKVYSIIPSDGSGDLDFVRGSDGTRINSLGQVENVCWNLLQYSEVFSNTYWDTQDATIASNSTTAPNDTLTADTFTRNANVGYLFTRNPLSLQTNKYSISIYAKANTNSSFRLDLATGGLSQGVVCFFDLSNGTASTPSLYGTANNFIATIENVGNGWYRCSLTGNLNTSASYYSELAMTSSGSIFIWGLQLNIGALKPYFPTTDRLNVPRLTYENGCPSLLLEKQSSNSLLYSEDFTNGNWANAGGTVTGNTTISPDGTQNADTLTGARYQGGGSSNTWIFSCYAKKVDGDNKFLLRLDVPALKYAQFDLNTGTIDTVSSGYSATIKDAGNGWYRCTLTTPASTSISNIVLVSANGGANSTYVWGAQIEASAYPTSYIPTTSTSVTRLADSCYKTGISSLIGQTEGTVFVECVIKGNRNGFGVNIFNTEYNAPAISEIAIGYLDGAIVASTFLGNTTYNDLKISAGSFNVGDRLKIGYRYKSGDFALYVNGVLIGTNTNIMTFNGTKNEIYLGATTTYYNYQEAISVGQCLLFERGLTNTELAQLTTI